MTGTLSVNGTEMRVSLRGDEVLLDLLRDRGYTEVKEGCREGACGSCLVLLDGVLVNSCQVLAASALGREVTTVKGLGRFHEPHPIQEAFVEAGAVQCGFCTPGMVLATFALLKKIPRPSEEQIRRALDGNLCRCTGYVKIIDAVRLAAERMASDGR
jgi:aerobic-type carbon monoxide dehydrogenase small subunit (CoxS/CutS family)